MKVLCFKSSDGFTYQMPFDLVINGEAVRIQQQDPALPWGNAIETARSRITDAATAADWLHHNSSVGETFVHLALREADRERIESKLYEDWRDPANYSVEDTYIQFNVEDPVVMLSPVCAIAAAMARQGSGAAAMTFKNPAAGAQPVMIAIFVGDEAISNFDAAMSGGAPQPEEAPAPSKIILN